MKYTHEYTKAKKIQKRIVSTEVCGNLYCSRCGVYVGYYLDEQRWDGTLGSGFSTHKEYCPKCGRRVTTY